MRFSGAGDILVSFASAVPVRDRPPLVSAARLNSARLDRGYESTHIEAYSRRLGHVPIIDRQLHAGCEQQLMTPHQRTRFAERTTAERVNARVKDEFGDRYLRVSGHAKVMAHLMFGVLFLTADQLLRLAGTPPPTPA